MLGDPNPDGKLTLKQKRFVELATRPEYSNGQAAREAGYRHPYQAARQLLQMPKIQRQIIIRQKAYEENARVSRREVIDIFREAVQISRIKADSATMVKAASELGKMCGYYNENQSKITQHADGSITIEQIRSMSDDELVRIELEAAEAEAAMDEDVIDGEYDELELETAAFSPSGEDGEGGDSAEGVGAEELD